MVELKCSVFFKEPATRQFKKNGKDEPHKINRDVGPCAAMII